MCQLVKSKGDEGNGSGCSANGPEAKRRNKFHYVERAAEGGPFVRGEWDAHGGPA
jgi:hypothetical protein